MNAWAERVDVASVDLRRRLPRWAARALGMPGHASLRRARPVAAARAEETSEAARRTLGITPHEGQLVASAALTAGLAVELDTGEGKTLAGAIAAAWLARDGRRVHVLSVNDYLARRDAEWMGALFAQLGVTVAWIGQASTPEERRAAYAAQIVYAPVSEVGYDLLRDRQVTDGADRVSPVFDAVIVDEADAVMIDEAMTPLVLAGTGSLDSEHLSAATALVRALDPVRHYAVDADHATVTLTDAGLDDLERRLGGVNLFELEHSTMLTRINLALHAHTLVHRDVDYLVTRGGIRLINAARGRIAQLQRWPDGLHAAIEVKEGLAVSPPGVILDAVTVQDLLLRYRTLSGMSGTILPVAEELLEFYSLPAARIERHRPNIRVDEPLRVFRDVASKTSAVAEEILRRHEMGQPVLVGTQSVAESEALAALLPARLGTRVLNARNDAAEATIVARAGEPGAVTVSTQMSGRGTDIRLGGADERAREKVADAGGLAVISTTPYPSRRLDLQLRGRAGRQGDPGVSVCFASVEDDLVQAHASSGALNRITRSGFDERAGRRVVSEAQRIAETVRLGQHRATWQYHRAIAAQREKVLAVREEVLAASCADASARARRLLTLYFLDERWQQHLAELTEVRDGIYLRVLAGQNPVDEFHRIALRSFAGFFDAVRDAVAEALAGLSPEQLDDPLGHLGLRRPSATWTYMIRDNPLGDAGSRAAEGIRRLLRGARGGH